MGVFKTNIEGHFVNYARPQENGNKSEVRWVELSNINEDRFLIQGDKALNVSFRKYTTKQLNKANYPYELKENPYMLLNIDFEQGAIGNVSCGPIPMEKYFTNIVNKNYLLRVDFSGK